MAQLEQSGAHPVDGKANTEVLGFNKHQTPLWFWGDD